jgi:hypothetical protein
MRPPKIATTKNAFLEVRLSADGLFDDMRPFLDGSYQHGKNALRRKQAERIVSFAFLTLIAGWEEFLFWLFLRYMMGASAPGGVKPGLLNQRSSTLLNAARTLTDNPNFDPDLHYYSWRNWPDLLTAANLYFTGGAPFSAVVPDDVLRLAHAQGIRNRVAHRSKKCIAEFKRVARFHYGLLPAADLANGTDPGRLLCRDVSHVFPVVANQTYYEAYSQMFERLANQLAP